MHDYAHALKILSNHAMGLNQRSTSIMFNPEDPVVQLRDQASRLSKALSEITSSKEIMAAEIYRDAIAKLTFSCRELAIAFLEWISVVK